MCMTLPQPTCLHLTAVYPVGQGPILGTRLAVDKVGGGLATCAPVHLFVVRVLVRGVLHDRQAPVEGKGKWGDRWVVFCSKGEAEFWLYGVALTPSSCRPTLIPSTPCSSFPSAAWTLFSVSLLSRNLCSRLCQHMIQRSGLTLTADAAALLTYICAGEGRCSLAGCVM